jgi:PST family polysaccharide transporter
MPSVGWAVGQQVARQALALIGYVGIARFILPGDLGLLGIATIWTNLLAVFTDLGVASALVQRHELREEHKSTALALTVAAGLATAGVSVAAAPVVARVMKTPAVSPVIVALSLNFVLMAVSSVPTALAQRELKFRALTQRDVVATLFGISVGILAAAEGWGVWALVAMSVVTSAVSAGMLWWLAGFTPRRRFVTRQAVEELWSYGSRLFAFGIFKYAVRNLDTVLIAYLLGPVPLGSYLFAQRIALQPVAGIEAGIGGFFFARASRLQQEPDALTRKYLAAMRLLQVPIVGWAILLATVGRVAVVGYAGERWASSAGLLFPLAVLGICHAAMGPTGSLMKALGRPGWLLGWSVGLTAATLATLAVGLRWSLDLAVWLTAVVHVGSIAYLLRTARRHLPVGAAAFLGAAVAYLPLAAIAFGLGQAILGLTSPAAVAAASALLGVALLAALAGFEFRALRSAWAALS